MRSHNGSQVPRFPSKGFCFLVALGFYSSLGSAALLSIPTLAANNGHFLATSVSLSTEGSQISGLQFDLQWEEGLEVQIAGGTGLGSNGKLLYAVPVGTRHLRVLLAGLSDSVFADGEIIRLFVAVNRIEGSAPVVLRDVMGVTAWGDPVSIRSSDGAVRKDPAVIVSSITAEGVLNAASLLTGPVAPGEIVTFLGTFGISGPSPQIVATANRAPAVVLYALGNQVNAILPLDMDPANPAELELRDTNRQLAQITMPVTVASPALFTQSGTGLGPGAILNQDYSLNTPANPAVAGSIVMMYGTGFGPLKPSDGQLPPLTALPVTATIAGAPADVTYAGAAPGLPDGVVQVNVRIPDGIPSGDSQAISLRAGSFPIQNGVTLAVR